MVGDDSMRLVGKLGAASLIVLLGAALFRGGGAAKGRLLASPSPLGLRSTLLLAATESRLSGAVSASATSASSAVEAVRLPHPISAAHRRIFDENNLIGRLNAAMDMGDVGELRRLLEQYRAQYPEDEHELQQPYALIADCQEHLTDQARERARRYWNEHRSSTLRRYLRRHCLEGEG
jgi:hypothetical protein